MANRIKGITVEIGGDTTGLDKALKSVNSSIKTTQSALRDVNRLLKLDPTNTDLLAQKQKLLKDAIGSTKEKLDALKTAQEQAKAQLENGTLGQDKYDALQREIIETTQELERLQTQAIESNATLAKIEEVGGKLQATGDKISGVGEKLMPVTAGITALGTAAVKTTADFDSSMSQVQATMGITADSMSELNGESVNTVDSLRALAKQMGSETAFSASECADAMNYLALAGYDTQEIYDTLPTVLNLAAAGGIDLASASDMVTDAMSALGIITPIEAAKNKVKGVVDAIKGFFSGMKISLPHIKLPHFRVSGKLSISPPSVPKLSIDWYKEGGIMTRPTVFGMNGSSLMAGGEAGAEAILPLKGFYEQLENILTQRMGTETMEKYLSIIATNSSKGIYLEDGTLVGHLLPAIDSRLGQAQKLNARLSL